MRVGAILTAACFLSGLFAMGAPAPAEARVDPLNIISQQIHKPNMLIVLDTSGSLTGVPGGSFVNADEVGVDCNDGDNCRGGTAIGTCRSTNKACISDDDCRSYTCKTDTSTCTSDSDCSPVAGKCSTGQACFSTSDCPSLDTGKCASSGSACDAKKTCSSTKKCSVTKVSCTSESNCRDGVCADNSTTCDSSADCPPATSGGTCAWGTTPTGGCSSSANCQVRPKVCSDNPSKTCSVVNDCGGVCTKSGAACTVTADCPNKNDSCSFSGKSCSSPTNTCMLPNQTCTLKYAGNVCQETNACVGDPNPCTGVQTNSCMGGVTGDLCNLSGATSGSRMCRISNMKCTKDSDCPMSGDSCGPATSRMIIAKRVIRNLVHDNANVVNMGFMTFYQSGYFPYYATSGVTTSTQTATLKNGQLESNKCYSKKIGLQPTCTISGKTYTLKGGNNTRYLVKGAGGTEKYVDAPYCGWFCTIPGVGTGVFKGAYYDYAAAAGTQNTLTTFSTYNGQSFTQGGVTYTYYQPRPDFYNGGAAPPISVVSCGTSCSASCGGRWDTQLAPFLTTDDSPDNVTAVVDAFTRWMEPASAGGLIAYGGTPTGCTLENDKAQDANHSAYHYMKQVKSNDTLPCRQNFVLLITDGEANGPGDSNCTSSACSSADPQAAGCTCKAVLAAWHMRRDMGVKTYVVGFSTDAATGTGRVINDNIAKAGGTDASGDGNAPFAFGATNEKELTNAIQAAIYEAVKGSYSTSPSTETQGTQTGNQVRSGSYVLDSRVDFPTWKGHLLAYDMTNGTPRLAWDAGTLLESRDWRTRSIYTSDKYGQLVKIQVDSSTGTIRNAEQLYSLGLGASADEADRIARFLLGDPTMKNPAVLGAVVNSTPVDVGPPPDSPLPGGHAFYLAQMQRPSLTYVGSDDGLLHAFYSKSGTTVTGYSYQEGTEAFAYLPPAMMKTIATLYAQGGQISDPKQHIYGLASSPKIKNLCVANCGSDTDAVWKTVLVMTEGWGGNDLFALDVTNPVGSSQPFSMMWHSATVRDASIYNQTLGLTVSVPAFMFNLTDGMDDYRLLLASGYPVDDTSQQGRTLMGVSAQDGSVTMQTSVPVSGTCAQDYTVLTDAAISRLQYKTTGGTYDGRRKFLAGYVSDTWGNMWRYTMANGLELVSNLTCQHPLHFAPTVVQLDADDPSNPNSGSTYLVQVTNSTLDQVTAGYEPSKMVIMKELTTDGVVKTDTTFGANGQLVLSNANTTQICAVTDATGQTCVTRMPDNARPLSTPMAVPKRDGNGFLILSHWYVPNVLGCGKGTTYFLMHEFTGTAVILRQAVKIADEPVTSPLVISGNLVVVGAGGPVNVGSNITSIFINTPVPSGARSEIFMMSGWTEVE